MLRIFFRGGAVDAGREEQSDALTSSSAAWKDLVRGVTLPWPLVALTGLGGLLVFSRLLLGNQASMANSDHVVGALVITVAIIATAEVARLLRFVNVPLGGWLVLAPWLLEGASPVGKAASVVLGLAIIGLSLPRGRRSDEHYASWDRFVI